MNKRARFIPYQPKTILNKKRRADHWFWTRYSAYPYKGCQHGCEFCYCREKKYAPFEQLDDFSYTIQVKENAAQLLRKALSRVPVDLISVGDYQPAERKFELTRRMLEVCCDLSFPVFILTRSPLVVRDLDLLMDINKKAKAVVLFSVISTPDSTHYQTIKKLERLTPDVKNRFHAMEQVAATGISTGTCFMPILPSLCDDNNNIDNVVRWTSNHGGSFLLASPLTLADQQRDYFLNILRQSYPHLVDSYESLYGAGRYTPFLRIWYRVARIVGEACQKYGLRDRMPRPLINREQGALSKLIAERLANRAYEFEITEESSFRVWTYRKAAWAIEEAENDIGLLYQHAGINGLVTIPGIGPQLAGEVEGMILDLESQS